MPPPASPDLTPFGFTATESRVYGALLRLGPSTGYSVAHRSRLARANSYGALEGLVTRRAATRLPGRPARYRATDPQALLAQLAAAQGEALERLGRALQDLGQGPEPQTRALEGAPAIANLILQLVARAERRGGGCLAPPPPAAAPPAGRRRAHRGAARPRGAG